MEPPASPDADAAAALATLAPSARAPSRRTRLGIGAAIVLFILALLAAVAITAFGGSGVDETVPLAGPERATGPPATPDAAEGGARIYVHVLGAVGSAGLYELADGSRVIDVIAAAGGFADDADPAGVNLARPLADGEQLRVPRAGEVPVAPPQLGGTDSGAGTGGAASGPVSLNSATLAELETLPRIGPALAQRILDWREANGGFSTIDDLRNVTGIGQKTFDGLKDHVTL
ncbi:competence protein ComEA [Microterricola gilva]|uniref:Competence protein ComEA n=1 Tax=Microterricola gilva TaxID=393267 RepID=A0A4Q8ALK2_9MICO|nr:helix-hairpin-helix domain-containing protein [Microterricola gilva]RZU65450.1 competence protein ComEA [Microterricola gilva]